MGRVRVGILAGAAVLAAPALRAAGQPAGRPDLWSVPNGPVVGYIFGRGQPWSDDAGAAARALLVPALSRSLIPDLDAARMTGRVLAAGIGAGSEWRICVIDLRADPAPAKFASGAAIRSLGALLEVKIDQPELVIAAIREACLTDPSAVESKLDGGEALLGRISGKSWPAWREVSWSFSDGLLRVWLGHDAMSAWGGANAAGQATGTQPGALQAQAAALHAGGTGKAAEIYINLNALRRSMPEVFVTGGDKPWLSPVLNGAGIANMRGLLVRASRPDVAGAPMRIDAAWSSRAEPPGVIHAATLTEDQWPEGAPASPDGAWSIVIVADWQRWVAAALDIRGTLGTTWEQYDWGEARTLWFRRHGPSLARVLARARPQLLVWQGTGPAVVECSVPLAGGEPLDAALAEVFSSLGAAPDPDGGWLARIEAFGTVRWWGEGDALRARFTPGPP